MENIKESNQIRKEIFNNVIARLKKEGLTLSEDDIKKIKFGFYSGTDKYLFKQKGEWGISCFMIAYSELYCMDCHQFGNGSVRLRNDLSKRLGNKGFIAVFLCVIAWESCYFFAWILDFCDVFGRRKVKIAKSIDFLGDFVIYGF